MKPIAITESKHDLYALERILGVLPSISFSGFAASGKNAAISYARSALLSPNRRVVLVIDSDSLDPGKIDEGRQFVNDYLAKPDRNRFLLVQMIPEFERVFFYNEYMVTKGTVEKNHLAPRQGLYDLKGIASEDDYYEYIDGLSTKELESIARNAPEIQEIASFLSISVSAV